MKFNRRNELLAAEAAEWVIALADANHQTRETFVDWLRASPEHVREFLAVSAIWGELPDVAGQPSVEELVRCAAKQSKVIDLPDARRSPARAIRPRPSSARAWLGRAALVALALLGVVLLVWNIPLPSAPELHTTATGEQSSIPLTDGSMVSLNTRSSLQVAFSKEYRDVELAQGEAFFDVVEDAARPFRVVTGQAVIQAVGTQFNVRANSSEVTVAVAEGAVEVSSKTGTYESPLDTGGGMEAMGSPVAVRIAAGQQARLRSGSAGAEVIDGAIEEAIAWRQRRLIFSEQPLGRIIEEFNRYYEPPAVIEDAQLKLLTITGVFRSDDRASFLQYLTQMGLADVVELEDGTIILEDTTNE